MFAILIAKSYFSVETNNATILASYLAFHSFSLLNKSTLNSKPAIMASFLIPFCNTTTSAPRACLHAAQFHGSISTLPPILPTYSISLSLYLSLSIYIYIYIYYCMPRWGRSRNTAVADAVAVAAIAMDHVSILSVCPCVNFV